MAYTTIDDPLQYFNTVLYTGTGSAQSITGVGFQPDWIWIKQRSGATHHKTSDSVRGATKALKPNNADEEGTDGQGITSFNSDGFSLGTGGDYNGSSNTQVAWNWKAGTSFSNDASSTGIGSIDSTGSVNTDAGFSIVSYTGTGSSGTIKHGLSSAPTTIFIKVRSHSDSWTVGHNSLGWGKYLRLDNTSAEGSNTNIFNNTTPTSTVFSVNHDDVNASGRTYIAYCFAEKQGYSKFGSYEGNGSSDGTFIYTGFKPAWVVTKSIDSTSHWNCKDNKRSTFNPVDDYHKLNEPTAEDTGVSNHAMDFLSNGFKHRGDNDEVNGSETYIYMAFAESPFVNSNGVPANAR
jgi:hypothetical protein